MIAYITMICQWVTLAVLIGIVWLNFQSHKNVRRLTDIIQQYRREIEWLSARVEALEGKANGSKQRAETGRAR